MGVTENLTARRLKDEKRLNYIVGRQLKIERVLDESTDDLIHLISEYDSLVVEREVLERNLDKYIL